jgi:hypothetical protein
VLAFDMPEGVANLSDAEVERFGGVALWAVGLANLRALPARKRSAATGY